MELLAGKNAFQAPIAGDLRHSLRYSQMLYPGSSPHTYKRRGERVGWGGVDVYHSLDNHDMKVPREGAEAVTGGRMFQTLTVLGKNELRW